MLLGIFGETVCQAAQAFLPPRIGAPRAAWRLMRALAACATLIGVANATLGVALARATLPLFTSSAAVAAEAAAAMPLLSAQALLHAVSMGTEGVLLAARDTWFLVASYCAALAMLHVRPPAVHVLR
jgi:Na+-driven multidrug efflux pump